MKKILLLAAAFISLNAQPSQIDQTTIKACKGVQVITDFVVKNPYKEVYCPSFQGGGDTDFIMQKAYYDAGATALKDRFGSFGTSNTSLMGDAGIQTGIDWRTWLVNYNLNFRT